MFLIFAWGWAASRHDPNFDVFNDSKIQSARDAPRSSCGARLCLLTIETLPLPQDAAPGRYSANVRILRISFRVIGAIARASVRHSRLARLAQLHAAHHRTLFFAVLAPPVAVLRYRRFSRDLLLSDFALGPDKIIGAASGRHQRLALDQRPRRQRVNGGWPRSGAAEQLIGSDGGRHQRQDRSLPPTTKYRASGVRGFSPAIAQINGLPPVTATVVPEV